MAKSYVYFITTNTIHKYVKIGKTSNSIKKRISELQTGNPYKIYLIGWIKCSSDKQAKKIEGSLHTLFKNKRKSGEWFNLCDSDYEKIINCKHIKDYYSISKSLRKKALLAGNSY